MRIPVLVPVFVFFMSACGTASRDAVNEAKVAKASDEPSAPAPVAATLAAGTFDVACGAAREALSCGGTMSAEGQRYESCDCTATGDGKTGRLEVKGEEQGGAKVDASFELVQGDAGWTLGKRLR